MNRKLQVVLISSLLILLCGCASDRTRWPHPTDADIARNAARAAAEQPGINAREYERWSQALATGETVFTIFRREGGRTVVTDVELFPDRLCYTVLASRGARRWDDYWFDYGRLGRPLPRACHAHAELRFRPGDSRNR